MIDKRTWIDKNKVYAVKMTNRDKANSLALNVEFGYKDFPGICFYIPGERGHMIEGHLGEKTDAGFTFVSEGFEPGTWEFIEVTYDNFKDEYQHIVIAGNKILEQVSNTEELIDWYHDNF